MYVLFNLNPLRDKYYGAKSGGDYIRAPGSREYHTDISRATRFSSVEKATKAAIDMQRIHRSIVRHDDDGSFIRTGSFAHDHEMSKETTPLLQVCELECTAVTLSDEDSAKQQKYVAELDD